jgi:hypothetical protein
MTWFRAVPGLNRKAVGKTYIEPCMDCGECFYKTNRFTKLVINAEIYFDYAI